MLVFVIVGIRLLAKVRINVVLLYGYLNSHVICLDFAICAIRITKAINAAMQLCASRIIVEAVFV